MICASAASLVLFAACGALHASAPTPTPTPNGMNLFIDGGFEETTPPWVVYPPLPTSELVSGQAHAGVSSFALRLRDGLPALAIMQSVDPAELPEFLSGFYRVDAWPGGAYLQFVVKVQRAPPGQLREMRFIIAGAANEPEQTQEARYVFLSRAAPKVGDWVYFSYPVRQGFADAAGAVPASWTSVDVSLELRALREGGTAAVYLDDLYLGPQSANPNHPPEKRH